METYQEFKEQALKLAKELFFVLPTEDQLQEAYDVYTAQPEEDPSGDWLLWTEHALRSADVEQMSTIKYKGTKYPVRTIDVKFDRDDEPNTIKIGTESLQEALDGKYEAMVGEEYDIDCDIYYYVADDEIRLDAKEIVEKHLDAPLELA